MTEFSEAEIRNAMGRLKTIANWQIRELLGHGGFSWVFKAEKTLVNGEKQLAAIKVINPRVRNRDGIIEQFGHEFDLMRRLNSPFISKVLDSGREMVAIKNSYLDVPWIATELVPGENLHEEINAHGILDKMQWLELAHDLLSAVAETHQQGLVHLDIKPQNIMRHSRKSILIDFGGASYVKVLDPGDVGTRTLGFCAPEQIDGKTDSADLGYEADIFSVGTTLVYAATGLTPWDIPEPSGPIRNEREKFLRLSEIQKKLHLEMMGGKKPRLKGLDEEQTIIVKQMLEPYRRMRPAAADLLTQVKALLPEGSQRKAEVVDFARVRSVPQFLEDPKAKKMVKAAEARNSAGGKPAAAEVSVESPRPAPKPPTENWLRANMATILLFLFTGPIGSSIRFHYLENNPKSGRFALGQRQLSALFYGLSTFGIAVPIILWKWRKDPLAARVKLFTWISIPVAWGFWLTIFIGMAAGEGSDLYGFMNAIGQLLTVPLFAIIPTVAYGSLSTKIKPSKQGEATKVAD
jgi:serine/threonine protein kinase